MPIRTDRITPIKKHTNKKNSIIKALEESQPIEPQSKKEPKKQSKKIQPLRNPVSKLIQAKNDLEIESATIDSILKQENDKETNDALRCGNGGDWCVGGNVDRLENRLHMDLFGRGQRRKDL